MKNWHNLFTISGYAWAFLGVLLIPVPLYLFDFQEKIAPFCFGNAISWGSKQFLGVEMEYPVFTSDTPALYGLAVLLGIISVAIAILIVSVGRLRQYQSVLVRISRVTCCYYLSLQLLKYGFDKIFKAQFYLPEPNILYTPVGALEKDILFWTTMGTSWSYNVFLGLMEVVPAVFLLFRKTRVLGLIIAVGVLLHVVALNYSFGITVKFFSSFLLLLSLLLLTPFFRSLYSFLMLQKSSTLPKEIWELPFMQSVFMHTSTKTFVIGIIFLEALFPYLQYGNFNDDLAPRPVLHGAYQVVSMIAADGDTLPCPLPVKRFFIHRHGYLIFQDNQDRMQDFKLTVDTGKQVLAITDYALHTTMLAYRFQPQDSVFELQYPLQGRSYRILARPLQWQQLPVLQRE